MIKKIRILLLLLFLLTPLVTLADSLSEYQGCIDDCYSHDDWNNEQYSNCLQACGINFPQGSREWGERANNSGAIKLGSTANPPSNCPAGRFCLNVPILGLKEFTIDSGSNNIMGLYIQAWYGFFIGTIGIIATVMVMWGGFKYLTSRGDKGQIQDAQNTIISAITGLVLAFGTYSILNIINPNLLTIKMPTLEPIQAQNDAYSNVGESAAAAASERAANASRGGSGGTCVGCSSSVADLASNFQSTLQSAQTASGHNFPTPNNTLRPEDTDSLHGYGRAADYPTNDSAFNSYMESLIQQGTPATYDFDGQPVYYVTFPDGTSGRVIDERSNNNCWHVDNGQRGENFRGRTL